MVKTVKVNYLIEEEVKEQIIELECLLRGWFKVVVRIDSLIPLKDPFKTKLFDKIYKLAEDHYVASDTEEGLRKCLEALDIKDKQ